MQEGEAAPLTDWVELENGCICCSVKNEMVKSLESLLQQRIKFDYIIIETTGLANPGPVAAALWTDPELESSLCLDAIVTVVDAVNIKRHMTGKYDSSEHGANEAQRQLAFADVILLNKMDLVSGTAAADTRAAIRQVNADARIIECTKCEIDLGEVLHTGIYAGNKINSAEDNHGEAETGSHCPSCTGAECSHKDHSHLEQVCTYTLKMDKALDLSKLRLWLDEFLWNDEETNRDKEVYRVKGLLQSSENNNKWILQAVHELYDILEGPEWDISEVKMSKLVFIGRNLNYNEIADAVNACQVS